MTNDIDVHVTTQAYSHRSILFGFTLPYRMYAPETGAVMISNEALGKHVGIDWVCQQLGFDLKEDVMIFGDGENDLGMFQASAVFLTQLRFCFNT